MTAAMTFDERYRVISSRERRFDGQFVTAVRTTGVYCRPSCPARTPKPGNVTFYATAAAAHAAGYRACKRCLPEATPGSPEWDLRGDVVGRAMRLIQDGVVEREGVGGLARRLGYSTRHLSRVLQDELGAGPLALARAHRAQTARLLLVGTDLPIAEVAFSAGFGSVRACNETIRAVFDLTPVQLRNRRPVRLAAPPGQVRLQLPYRAPFDSAGVFAWLAARALPGVERATEDSYERMLALPGGAARFRVTAGADHLVLTASLHALADLPVLVSRVRRLFDLDADPEAIELALDSMHPSPPVLAAVQGVRVPGTAAPEELLIRAMVGQQISVASARTLLARLVDELGEQAPPDDDLADTARPRGLFPTMATIAEHGGEVLRGPSARIASITAVAAALASGELTLTAGDDSMALRERLLGFRGIGPWTADYVRMRVLGDPDVFLIGDVAVRNAAAAAGLPEQAAALESWAAHASPWRSYLTARLWRSLTAQAQPAGATTQEQERTCA